MHIIICLCIFNTNLFSLVRYRNILSTTAEAAATAVAVLFFLFSTTGPFQGRTLPFQGKSFLFQGNISCPFHGHNYKEKGSKVWNFYVLLFLKMELLNSTLLSGFKIGWSIDIIIYIARKHEFQIAHIPIWTSVLDVDMKSCRSAMVIYPPSSPVPDRGEGV